MSNRDQMWGPMSLEDYAEKIGQDLSQRPVALTGLDTLPDMGGLRTARNGDSISAILGTSDPAAIGAFMHANGMKDSGLRAGQSYLVPRRADLADADMAGRGQAALNADNARAAARACSTVLPGDAVTVRPGAAVFDPQKGILATRPTMALQPGGGAAQAGDRFHRASGAVGIAGRMLDGFNLQNAALGALDGGRAAAKLGRVTGPLGAALVPLEHGFEGVSEIQKGAPVGMVAAGVASKSAVQGGGILAGMGAGAKLGAGVSLLFPAAAPVLIPVATAAGGIAGGYGTGKLLERTSNEALGRKVQRQMEELGRNPYGYGAF